MTRCLTSCLIPVKFIGGCSTHGMLDTHESSLLGGMFNSRHAWYPWIKFVRGDV
jgi:hypothetical protein